ncbi:MAG: NAD-dependent protein deacylase [Cellulosilyticaceae bacterium]
MKEQLQAMIRESKRIVFFGGAGVSTESGIPDFRSEKGIYETVKNYGCPPEQILSHTFFKKHPETFYDFYKKVMIYEDASPNRAHKALAKLEKAGKLLGIVTQNIDGLHQLAGNEKVYELHGSVHRNRCMKCGEKHSLQYVMASEGVPKCEKCGHTVKPEVVLYEEPLDDETMQGALEVIQEADMLIVGGTSLAVYPAAGFLQYYTGDKLVLINKSETPYDRKADLVIHESIGDVLGYLLEEEA